MPYRDPEQKRAHRRRYHLANRAKILEQSRLWRIANPDRYLLNIKRWQAAHPEKVRQYSRRWDAANVDHIRAYHKRWYGIPANHQRLYRANKQWRASNPEKVRAYEQRYLINNPEKRRALRARRNSAEGRFTPADIEGILIAQNRRCAYFKYCHASFGRRKYEIDHIIPVTRDGTSWPKNIQLTCRSCNAKKGNKMPDVFLRELRLAAKRSK